ncbi:hypothetical protein JB92DRAFT_3136359 [Gautieria morchelliformis]|nr:hypothetical protein JB92DRAFT_3136359 [Gautieria morchelliformis]
MFAHLPIWIALAFLLPCLLSLKSLLATSLSAASMVNLSRAPLMLLNSNSNSPPTSISIIWLDPPINLHATLRSDLASCYWETLKMKCCYILAATHEWKGDFDKGPLPQYIPNLLLFEIGMDPAEIRRHVKIWQENSYQLSAWIKKAKERSAKVPECSWSWPASPFTPFPIEDHSSSTSIDNGWRSNHCELDTIFMESPSASAHVARAFSVDSQSNSSKRTRAPSPAHSQRDGDDSNKRQLILWQPSVAQLLERYEALSCGEVASSSSSRVTLPSPYSP